MGNFDCCICCGDRHPGCHGKCEKYLAARKAYDEKMAPIRKEHEIKRAHDSYVSDRVFGCIKNPTPAARYKGKNRRHRK